MYVPHFAKVATGELAVSEVQQKMRANWSIYRIVREGVRRNALRVLRPKSPHSEEIAQYIEWLKILWGPHELRE